MDKVHTLNEKKQPSVGLGRETTDSQMQAGKLAELARLIRVARGEEMADLLIRNVKVLDFASGQARPASIAIVGDKIAGIGDYSEGRKNIDGSAAFALPGLMDAHIHIESSLLSPEEFARLVIPRGTTTVIADPHEIVNVAGLAGLRYMQEAAAKTPLKVEYMLPSCVPATDFEDAGAVITARDSQVPLADPSILGLAEMMNFVGVINRDPEVLGKIQAARDVDKPVDGHSPGLLGKDLNAYAVVGILSDHECASPEEMLERLNLGMYVNLRYGSACHDLEKLLPAVTVENSRRCLLCSDDRQAATILRDGHMNDHLSRCVRHGLEPLIAVQMATLNTAEAFGLRDRGALFPGKKADVVLVDDLHDFKARRVFIDGVEVARDGAVLYPLTHAPATAVASSCHVRDFSEKRLHFAFHGLPGASDKARVRAIAVLPGGVVTAEAHEMVHIDARGDFVYNPEADLVRVAVIERHHELGKVALGLLKDYGLKTGAIASSIAHDSHNIICVGQNTDDMYLAVEALIAQGGGIVLFRDGRQLAALPLPIAGLMSDQPGERVSTAFAEVEEVAHRELGVRRELDPVMTLGFMSLPVIPALKLTDRGLFDVSRFQFVDVELAE